MSSIDLACSLIKKSTVDYSWGFALFFFAILTDNFVHLSH